MSIDVDTRGSLPFIEAARYQGRVQGLTHVLYKYPARFSPVFARSAIETFTVPGDVVLDPFVGGGTTMVEARLSGRHVYGSDLSSLAVFVSRSKTVPLSNADSRIVAEWFASVSRELNIHRRGTNSCVGQFEGYDRNMPWRLRKLAEQYLKFVTKLPSRRHQRFARCVLLRCGQWAMDCRKAIPSVTEFREALSLKLAIATNAMREYRLALAKAEREYGHSTIARCTQTSASDLHLLSFGKPMVRKAKLILTSPPYPGVHVLYHRWNVQGRRESPAPFWLADCLDGQGNVYYSLGDRRQHLLRDYYSGIERAFSSLRSLLADDGIVVQLIAFSSPEWQLNAYLESMSKVGYDEVLPTDLGLTCKGRLWRTVPGRRWYSVIREGTPTSKELVLFHRKRRKL